MAEKALVSSPLSSVPSDLSTPSPPLHSRNLATLGRATLSPSPVRKLASESPDDEEWDENVFTDELYTKGRDTTNLSPSPAAKASSTQGFAQSEIDAAIAASLTHDTQTVPAKRARSAEAEASSEDAGPGAHKSPKLVSGAAKAAASRRKTMLFTSEKSPLARINLTKLLRLPEAWTALTYAQQKELAAMLPDQPDVGGTGAHDSRNVLVDALISNDALRTDVREWHESLQLGMEDPDWREEAAEAMEKRARGELGSGKWWDPVVEEEQQDTDGTANGVVEAWWKDPELGLSH